MNLILNLKKTKNFYRQLNKLITKGNINLDQYEYSRDLFNNNTKDEKLRPHKINCKYNKNIIAIDIINTQYRILMNCIKCDIDKLCVFSWIGTHRAYETIIKNKKNCKAIFVDCDQELKDI